MRQFLFRERTAPLFESRQERGLDAAEAEIGTVLHGPGKGESAAVPLPGHPVDHHTAGIADIQEFRGLVKSLAGRVIARLPQNRKILEVPHPVNIGVSAGNHQGDEGKVRPIFR